ncbi:MAG: ABC transporter ATP-binding protein [Christensenellaceae bacterium]|nr:ABC transporter ATP-binding protein [Christensenellaceae bacterium]
MIEIKNLTKGFGELIALNNVSCTIPDGCIFGLVGANGAGKSTLLRLLSGIYKPDFGSITVFNEEVYDNPYAKAHIAFAPDTMSLVNSSASLKRMAKFYKACYKSFSDEKFDKLCKMFNLNKTKRIRSFSKGMIRQAQTILALSCNADITLLDETFDGLDPIVRNAAKKLIYSEVCDRNATIIITSHSLRELEDTCDRLAMLYRGGLVFQSDVNELKTKLFKVQVAFSDDCTKEKFAGLDVVSFTKSGSVANLIIRGDKDETESSIRAMNPVLFELLPLSLEEVFVYEMDSLGYRYDEIM